MHSGSATKGLIPANDQRQGSRVPVQDQSAQLEEECDLGCNLRGDESGVED